MRPRCGLSPNRPLTAAGIRTDPAPSEPSAAGTSPAATAAADPALEPPVPCSRLQGLRLTPNVPDSPHGKMHSSGTCVLPITIAPAARTRRRGPARSGERLPRRRARRCPWRRSLARAAAIAGMIAPAMEPKETVRALTGFAGRGPCTDTERRAALWLARELRDGGRE